MKQNKKNKDAEIKFEQINIRVSSTERELIDRAAAYVKRTRSNFLLYATLGRAREILKGVVDEEHK